MIAHRIPLTAVTIVAALTFGTGCMGRRPSAHQQQTTTEGIPTQYTYEITASYPHSTSSYTQGLFWHAGQLYESTGQYGSSHMLLTDLGSGRALRSRALPPQYFGEGSAILDGRIYLLTWRERKAFVLDTADFSTVEEFTLEGEGWGITTDGERLYMSDGTDAISVLDPATFEVERTIRVKSGSNRLPFINELEWIEGELWANVYTSDFIARIDPATGRVTGVVDLGGILPASERRPDTDVLNGIAYDSAGKRIFVTGKNWSRLFEIKVKEKQR